MSSVKQQIGFGNSQEFIRLTNSIRKSLPRTYFYGIMSSYTINAIMIGFFIFPTLKQIIGYWAALIVAAAGTAIIQLFRGLIVFTDLLFAESGETSKLQVKIVALIMTLVGIFELYHLLSGFTDILSNGQIIGIFVFGSSIIVGGWMMEINFIKQTNEYIFQAQNWPKVGTLDGQPLHTNPELAEMLVLLKEQLHVKQQKSPTQQRDRNSQKKSGINQQSLKENGQEMSTNLTEANSQKKMGIKPQSLKENDQRLTPVELDGLNQEYQSDLEQEESLVKNYEESLKEPLELALGNANFPKNGHYP